MRARNEDVAQLVRGNDVARVLAEVQQAYLARCKLQTPRAAQLGEALFQLAIEEFSAATFAKDVVPRQFEKHLITEEIKRITKQDFSVNSFGSSNRPSKIVDRELHEVFPVERTIEIGPEDRIMFRLEYTGCETRASGRKQILYSLGIGVTATRVSRESPAVTGVALRSHPGMLTRGSFPAAARLGAMTEIRTNVARTCSHGNVDLIGVLGEMKEIAFRLQLGAAPHHLVIVPPSGLDVRITDDELSDRIILDIDVDMLSIPRESTETSRDRLRSLTSLVASYAIVGPFEAVSISFSPPDIGEVIRHVKRLLEDFDPRPLGGPVKGLTGDITGWSMSVVISSQMSLSVECFNTSQALLRLFARSAAGLAEGCRDFSLVDYLEGLGFALDGSESPM